jgi:hypothetical protein
MSTATDTALETHSEVCKLQTVMVHRPDLAHERLSPSNCHELLFDDVIWVRRGSRNCWAGARSRTPRRPLHDLPDRPRRMRKRAQS